MQEWEAAWVHGQVGVYDEARREVGHRGCGLQDGDGVHPYCFGDDVFRMGGHGYESLFWLSLCEVGVDVVQDAGRVRVKVAACEGLSSVFRCVAGVVEPILRVLLLACSASLVHAVTDGDSCWVGAAPGGRCGEEPLGFVVGVPHHRRVRVGAVEPWGYPCVRLWW